MLHSVLVRQATRHLRCHAACTAVQNKHYRTPTILVFIGVWRRRFAATPAVIDREEELLTKIEVVQQSASHAGRLTGVASAKIKSRIEIRRADKIEWKIAI
jgi:hypothetical protein